MRNFMGSPKGFCFNWSALGRRSKETVASSRVNCGTETGILDDNQVANYATSEPVDALRPWSRRGSIYPRDPDFACKARPVLDLYHRR